jgi:hypothetical protein
MSSLVLAYGRMPRLVKNKLLCRSLNVAFAISAPGHLFPTDGADMKCFVEQGDNPPSMVLCSITPNETPPPAEESLSQRGAMALAKRLEKYWHGKGYPAARFWAEPILERFEKVGTYELYRVVCNLKNGLPPRYRDEAR